MLHEVCHGCASARSARTWEIPMTRIGILISALILLVFASPSHALTFQYSFGGVEGLISGLEDNSGPQAADSVTITASPIGGLGEYAPGRK